MPDLSDVVSQFVRDSATGVLDAEVEAAAEREAFRDRLEASPEALVGPGEVDRFLRERFPPLPEPPRDLLRRTEAAREPDEVIEEWEPGETAVRPGGLYVHPERFPVEGVEESPPIERELGVSVPEEELDVRRGVALLTEEAVERVREAVAERIGERRRRAHARVADAGLPRPEVTSLDVEVKLAFGEDLEAAVVDARDLAGVEPEALGTLSVSLDFEGE